MPVRKTVVPHAATVIDTGVRANSRRRLPGLAGARLVLRQATREVHLRVEALFDALDSPGATAMGISCTPTRWPWKPWRSRCATPRRASAIRRS